MLNESVDATDEFAVDLLPQETNKTVVNTNIDNNDFLISLIILKLTKLSGINIFHIKLNISLAIMRIFFQCITYIKRLATFNLI